VTIGLAIVPSKLTPSLVEYVARLPARFFPMCHGWEHVNHASDSAPAEFGAERSLSELRSAAERAYSAFAPHFGSGPVILVPPYNRIAGKLIPRLPEIGFSGLSGRPMFVERWLSRLAAKIEPPGFVAWDGSRVPIQRFNVHIDLIAWRPQISARPLAPLAGQLVGSLRARRKGLLPAGDPVGILVHHLVHTPDIWRSLDQVLTVLRAHPATTFVNPSKLFRRT
jgi:hypothetical protein